MDVSVVLVSYNTNELTKSCLKSVFEQTQGLDFDLWVVDNASSDGSAQMIKEEFPQVNLIENKENLGYGRANNLAMRKANAKYILLLNTDTILLNNSIKIMFDFMENSENAKVGACGGQLYNQDMTEQGSVGEFDTLLKLAMKAFGLNFISRIKRFVKIFRIKILKDNYKEVIINSGIEYIIGADLMIRKSALDKTGLFDERFFMFGEEAELCFRLKKNGYKLALVPEARVIHFGGASAYKHNEKIEVEKMRIKSDFLFYEICYGKSTAKMAKFLLIIYYLRYYILRFFSSKSYQRLKTVIEAEV